MSAISLQTFLRYGVCPLAALYIVKRILSPKRQESLPPGPPGLPIIGNLLDFPSSNPWETYTEWSKTYGDIIYLNMAGTPIIILNSLEATSPLFESKSSIYSNRATLPFSTDIVGWRELMIFQPDGPHLKEHRRLFAHTMGSKAALERFAPLIEAETCCFLQRVLDQPNASCLSDHVRKLAGAIILNITYGYKVQEGHDEMVDLIQHTVDEFSEASMPGTHLVDTFPWLQYLPRWFPGGGFWDKAAVMRDHKVQALNTPYQWTRDQMAKGVARPSFVTSQLEGREVTSEQENDIKWVALAMFGGGADTTVSALYSFFLFMTLHPEVQQKAQAEIDALTNGTRLPTLADRHLLPYVDALVKEVLRCGLIIPQGGRQLSVDDVYNGYLFPKGSIVICNIWQMLHDPQTYVNPDKFDPSRFLGSNPEPDPREVFGFGRRICPGRFLADSSIFIACAMILASMNISKLLDGNGKEIRPQARWSGNIVIHPEEFECVINARSPQAHLLVRAEAER